VSEVVAIVVAGGAARRLGGVLKPAVPVAGVRMLDRVLAAVSPAARAVVVGPPELSVPAYATRTREDPPGGGPVAALVAGLAAATGPLPAGAGRGVRGIRDERCRIHEVVLLAADLVLLDGAAIGALLAALRADDRADGVVYVDVDGRRQWLCSAWRWPALGARLDDYATARGGIGGAPLREALGSLRIVELRSDREPPPWFDCDTDDDVARAEGWLADERPR
jgi:molybdopterin-guanine dinucleotide biosynthesis protein A